MGPGSKYSQTVHQAPGNHGSSDARYLPGVTFQEESETGECWTMLNVLAFIYFSARNV